VKNFKQILLAFFIPLSLAVSLIIARLCIFYDLNRIEYITYEAIFAIREGYGLPLEMEIPGLFIWAMFILSLTLPSFVLMRTYQGRRNKLESASIIE
jgi:hypothetical protein